MTEVTTDLFLRSPETQSRALTVAVVAMELADDIVDGDVSDADLRRPYLLLQKALDYQGEFGMVDNTIADYVDPNEGQLADALPESVKDVAAALDEIEATHMNVDRVTDEHRQMMVPELLYMLAQTILEEVCAS